MLNAVIVMLVCFRFATSGSFGFGARKCPGRMMAQQEIACLLVALLSKFRLEYHYEPLEMSSRLTTVLSKEPRFAYIPLNV